MIIPTISAQIRPNRLEEKTKDKDYHSRYARWILSGVNHPFHQLFQVKSIINWNFYENRQWIFNEDLEGFLMDESGETRNRIKFTHNIISPIVEQYVGNAVRMDFNAKAVSISNFAVNRRDRELARLKFFSELAQDVPDMKEFIKGKMPIGDTPEETEKIFDNVYVDDYERAINNLIKYESERNDMEDKKVSACRHLAVTGLGILKNYERNGQMIIEVTDPLYFFFDRSAQRPDLKDAEWMGEYNTMLPTDIFERFQDADPFDRDKIERYVNNQIASTNPSNIAEMLFPSYGRVPVYEVYWKDMEVQEYGYVKDPFGYEYFTKINSEDSDYKTKDLIKPSENGKKKLLKDKKSRKLYVDIIRYCIIIPAETMSGQGGEDIILEYGMLPYQETYTMDVSNVEFPYKCHCWNYHLGNIISPLDKTIDPQRMVNRMLSMAESQINNSRGSGTIIDSDTVDPQGGEEEIQRSMNLSKPVFVKAGRNLNNAIGKYDSTIGNGVSVLYNVVDIMQRMVQASTGVNEAMQGTTGGSRQLVGVTQSNIQRGTLMQEPFYYALSKILLQSYQAIATQGKKIYADNQRRLSIITGDKGAEDIIITKEMKLEDFRIFIKRESSTEEQIQTANAVLLNLKSGQLVDDIAFANYFNRGTMDDVAAAIRESIKRKMEAQRIMEERANQEKLNEANKMGEIMEAQQMQKSADDMDRDKLIAQEQQHDLDKETMKMIPKMQP